VAATPESGFLLLADLTGYTAYLSRGEIEHAPTIAGDLLETVVGRLEPPFRLAKLEGDAAFLFVEDGRAEPSLLIDAIEACYFAFRRRLNSIEQASACDCNACRQAPRLDLKFFVHHGQFVRGRIAGREELAGSSVIVVHRLLKGTTAQAAHAADGTAEGFAVFTGEALAALRFDPASLDLEPGSETLDHLGNVSTHTLDLERAWQVERGHQRLTLGAGDGVIDLEAAVAAEPAEVWAHLTAPALRPLWEGPLEISESGAVGRRGVGTRAVCVTRRLSILEEIVDWQPFDHVAYRLAVPGVGPVDATYDLAPADGITHIRLRWGPSTPEAVSPVARARIRDQKRAALDRLVARLATHRTLQEVHP
jgi:uncharacterized protein YndB with AHSA1/START domain